MMLVSIFVKFVFVYNRNCNYFLKASCNSPAEKGISSSNDLWDTLNHNFWGDVTNICKIS